MTLSDPEPDEGQVRARGPGALGDDEKRNRIMLASPAVARVIQSCLDDERTLVREARHVDARQKSVLAGLADERRRFAEDLERLNGQSSRESWSSLLRELGSDLRARAAGSSAGGAIAACRRSRDRTQARYEKALATDLPAEVKAALELQRRRLVLARDELDGLDH